MKYKLIITLLFLSLFSFGQEWENLSYSPDQPGLELNPLKGLAPLYNVNNEFPYSIHGKIVGLDKIMFGFNPSDFDWSEFDNFIATQSAKGKFAKLQVNVDMGFNNSDLPQFLKDLGVPHAYYGGQGEGDNQGVPSVVVDYNNEHMMRALRTFIVEFGKKYNNNPGVFLVHYGLYGIFGEWGLGSGEVLVPEGEVWAMTKENQYIISDLYQASFPNKKLITRFAKNVPEPQAVGYSDGLYFGASISDNSDYFWFLHPSLIKDHADLNWKNHPIGGEIDPSLHSTIWESFPNVVTGDPLLIGENPPTQNTDDVFNITRPTFLFQDWIFNKSEITQESNPTMWANALKATKKTGYTFYIDQFKITAEDGKPAIEVNILNKGLAPMYDDWEVEFGYLGANGEIVSLGSTDNWKLSTIQPETNANYRSFASDIDIDNGTHTFVLRVKNPLEDISSSAEPVRFANATQDQNVEGWLTLGDASIDNGNLATLPIKVSNMFLIPNEVTLAYNEQFKLTAQVFPGIATNRNVTWSSNKPRTASVDENGLVSTYELAGEVEITATTEDGGIQKIATITVNPYWNVPGLVESEGFTVKNGGSVEDAPDGEEEGGFVVGFIDDNTWLDYTLQVNKAGTYTLDVRASNPFNIGVVDLLNEDGEQLARINFNPATNGDYDAYLDFSSDEFTLTEGVHTLRLDVVTSAINLNWMRFNAVDGCDDADNDGVCDTEDQCPELDDALIGTACNDNNACTANDVYTADCGCAGTLMDSDNDGVCDTEDQCPELDDALIGTACDDNDACTVNDVYTADCGCEGTLMDSDNDGVCDTEDQCPDLDDALIGTACDDNDPCTVNDVYTTDCGCAGTFLDSDNDGVCDTEDQCPELDDALIGTACDDNNACTVNDVYSADCGCAGTLLDSDNDGVCDTDDQCPELDDALIGTACDDNNACTVNDVYSADCGCAGTLMDSDNDGVCDAQDQCPELDDALIGTACDDNDACTVNDVYTADCGCAGTLMDSDNDGVCDTEDQCPELDDALIGTACDDNDACTVNDIYTADCGCAGTLMDSDKDGVCDAEDQCPNLDDALIGTACDDNDPCTVNDLYTTDCGCAGTLMDSDNDGVCDTEDQCPNLDDALIGTACDDNDANTVNDIYTEDCGCVGEADNSLIMFELVNADSDISIDVLSDGDVINTNEVGWNLNVEAITSLSAGSIQFDLNETENFRTENAAPYAMAGDYSGDFINWNPEEDMYTLTATVFSKKNRKGAILATKTISFSVVHEDAMNDNIQFQLVDSDTDQAIRYLTYDDEINLEEIGSNVNIVAEIQSTCESIVFSVNNESDFRTENSAPYAFAGDKNGNYFNWDPESGIYYIKATAYENNGAQGDVIDHSTMRLSVIHGSAVDNLSQRSNSENEVDELLPEMNVYPNPFQDEVYMELDGFKSGTGTITISDISGQVQRIQKVEYIQNQKINMNLSQLDAGVYIIQYVQGSNRIMLKLVKPQ